MNKKRVLVLLGPNLDMIGIREKGVYGNETSQNIEMRIHEYTESLGFKYEVFQSNWKDALIDKIHGARGVFDGVVLNAGALAHYSYALRDAITCPRIPSIETHIPDMFAREPLHTHSILLEMCAGVICGFDKHSYFLTLQALKNLI